MNKENSPKHNPEKSTKKEITQDIHTEASRLIKELKLKARLINLEIRQRDDSTNASLLLLASYEKTPAEFLHILATQETNQKILVSVAQNPSADLVALKMLAKHKHRQIRSGVAQNPKTDLQTLKELSNDPSKQVREPVVTNPNTPFSILKRLLVKDEDLSIRSAVLNRMVAIAQNPNTKPETLEELATSKYVIIKSSLARNISLCEDIIKKLSKDADASVRSSVAQNPTSKISILTELAKDDSVEVKKALAVNPKTPMNLLDELSKDTSEYSYTIKYDVIRNKNVSISTLERLSTDSNQLVRYHAKRKLNKTKSQNE